jgi:hypothetical protein
MPTKSVVEALMRIHEDAPVYTVHENFITSVLYARDVLSIYTKVFLNMGAPLKKTRPKIWILRYES